MDIAELSKRTGLAASALRYYEARGLIQSCGRKGLRRLFSEQVLQRLALIALGQRAGFSLDEIGQMLTSGRIDRALLLLRADELDRRIDELAAMRDGLRHAAHCPAPDHFQCPKFLRLLARASARFDAS